MVPTGAWSEAMVSARSNRFASRKPEIDHLPYETSVYFALTANSACLNPSASQKPESGHPPLRNFRILFCFGGKFRYCIVVAGTPVFHWG
jgi:hypothetical protein